MTLGRLRLWWDALRASLWFVPALVVIGLTVLAVGLVEVDGSIDAQALAGFPRLFGAGAEGTRGMLEAIGSGMITIAGVTFSITIVALSLTSSQYSSRVLRNFMRDRSNQTVLGVFVGIYAYCLIVLRTIRGDQAAPFVPSIASLGAVVLAFIGIALLIHFIHHISVAIQASNILASIYEETSRAIGRLYPDKIGDEGTEDAGDALARMSWETIDATAAGYLQSVDPEAILRIACDHDAVVKLSHRIGEFVAVGQPVARVSPPTAARAIEGPLRRAMMWGAQRTVTQDAAFGIRQVVDIALKALSPAMNDPTTAAMCIDRLEGLVLLLARRRIPPPYRRSEGRLRVVAPAHDFASLLTLAVADVRRHAGGEASVLLRLAQMLCEVRAAVGGGPRLASVDREIVHVEACARGLAPEARAPIDAAIEASRAGARTSAMV